MSDPDAPDKGNGNEGTSQTEEPKWKQAGFESEDAMIESARQVADLKEKLRDAEDRIGKEKSSRLKTDTDYMRQAKEIGELRKKIKEAEGKSTTADITDGDGEDVVNSISEEEAKRFDEILNKPENIELKKSVLIGGKKAMAEFISSFRENAPIDLNVSVFASLNKNKTGDMIPKSSIAKMVKSLFEQNERTEKNKLPATGISGGIPDRETQTKKPSVIGTVTTDFFRKK